MASSLSERVRRLEDTAALLDEMSRRLRYLAPAMPELIRALAAQERFAALGIPQACYGAMTRGERFSDAWRGALAQSRSLLGHEETLLLAGLADVLGQTELESQLGAIACAGEALAHRIAARRAEAARKARLYRTMGALAGAAMAVILI
jgi:stage III sporulation protein AB